MSPSRTRHEVFLSYNSRDGAEVERIAGALRERELDVFLDRWYLIAGRPWPVVLEETLGSCRAVIVLLGPSGMGDWQQREMYLALSRQARDPVFPVIPVLLPGSDLALSFISLNTSIDLRDGSAEGPALDALAAAVRGQAPAAPDPAPAFQATCPFRGLRPFREEDAPFFCGREVFTERLLAALAGRSLVAVVGSSGSGKSSVVRAGGAHAIRRGTESMVWDIVTLVPGDRPLHALAAGLLPLIEPELSETRRLLETAELASYLAAGRIQLRDVVARCLERQLGTDRLLLVVDQWEELYTLVADAGAAARFTEEILDATERCPLSVVLTLRGDFYGHAIAHRRLADRLEGAVVNLGAMTREELRRAMEVPARKVGLSFEPGLVERILDELEDEPGHLPLLEFLLTELWEKRSGGKLLHASYDEMGALKGALAHRAESVVAQLPHSERDIRGLFLQLVRPGEGTEDTRRRASLSDLADGARGIVKALADARLVVTGRDAASGEETVEVAHEALVHNWARLRQWLDEDREFLLWRQRLRSSLAGWSGGRDDGVLVRGSRLIEAERWLADRSADLNPREHAFISESVMQREHEEQARRQQLHTIAEMQRKIALPRELAAIGSQQKLLFHFLDAVRIRLEADCAWIYSDPLDGIGKATRGDAALFDEALAVSFLAREKPWYPWTTILSPASVQGRHTVVAAARHGAEFRRQDRRTLDRLVEVLCQELERREEAKLAKVLSKLQEKIISELRPLDVIYHILDGIHQVIGYDHSASLLSYDETSGLLRIEAEKMVFLKKSPHIGTTIPISPPEAARLAQAPLEIAAGDGIGSFPFSPREGDVLPTDSLIMPLRVARSFRGLLRVAVVKRRKLDAMDRAILEQFMPVASTALRNLKSSPSWRIRSAGPGGPKAAG